jgi:hypothetical protein
MRVPGFLPLIWQAFAARLPLCRPSLADWRLVLPLKVVNWCDGAADDRQRRPDSQKKSLLVTAGFLECGQEPSSR